MLKSLFLILMLACLAPFTRLPLYAQEFNPDSKAGGHDIHPTDVILWTPAQALSDSKGRAVVGLRLETRDQFSIYKNKLEFRGPAGYSLGVKNAPPTREQQDPMGEGLTAVYDGGDFEIELQGDRPLEGKTVSIFVTFLGCTHKICLFPYTQELKVPIYLTEEKSLAPDAASVNAPSVDGASSSQASAPASLEQGPNLSVEEQYAEKLKSGNLSFGLLLLVVFIGGLATNLTPCVFPMIPITLRLLGRDGHKAKSGAVFYAAGIILTYTALGLVASLSGKVFGSVLANPWVNLVFGLIFIALAVTMLGFGDLSKLQNLGAAMGSGQASNLNSLGMGSGAGLVAAPCTGPIMGALIAYSTHLSAPWQSILLFFLYSLGFALPYVFLGMAAQRAKSFKVNPRVQVAIKMIFAAAMFGLAAYYLKNTAYGTLQAMKGYWQWLAVLLTAVGIVGLGIILAVPHLMVKKGTQLLPTLLVGLGLFSGVQWATGSDLASELRWIHDETAGYEAAKASGKPVVIDGWADWCIACKEMDKTTFHDPEVISLLKAKWVLVKLDMTEVNEANDALAAKYEMPGLPTLVLVPADGDLKKAKRLTGYVSRDRLIQELESFQGK